MTGGNAHEGEGVGRVREQLECGQQAGGDQQRLRDRGVANGLGVGLGPVVHEVQTGHRRHPVQPFGERGLRYPGSEESGRLGSLTGGDNGEHFFTIS